MEHLFVARQGCGVNSGLDVKGHKQMRDLGTAIKEILSGGSAYLISSTAPTAMHSSRVLADQLAISQEEVEYIPSLFGGTDAPEAGYFGNLNEGLMDIVNERRGKAHGLIIVSGMDVANFFPGYFLRKELGIAECHVDNLGNGHAVHFDLEAKTYRLLP